MWRAWDAAGRPGAGCGITLNGDWRVPFDPTSSSDAEAALRSLEWQGPLFADPIHFGDWPASIKAAVGPRVPGFNFTIDERDLIFGTHDALFFMNTYTSSFTRAAIDEGCGWNCDSASESSGCEPYPLPYPPPPPCCWDARSYARSGVGWGVLARAVLFVVCDEAREKPPP